MANLSNAYELSLITRELDGSAGPRWLMLTNTQFSDSIGNPDTYDEAYEGYARVAIDNTAKPDTWVFGTDGGGNTTAINSGTSGAIAFGQNTGTTANASGWAIVTTANGSGTVVLWQNFSSTVQILNGDTPQFDASSITITIN